MPERFALPGATPHYAADRPVRAEHVRLEVQLDFQTQSISGTCTTRVRAVRSVPEVVFDAVDLLVERVKAGGQEAPFSALGQKLRVALPLSLQAGETTEVTVHYRARPTRGLYFIGPDAAYPERPRQAWTQGQDEDARAWFPCLDAPAQKATTELGVRFPAEMVALSNGQRVEDRVDGDSRIMRFRLDAPHPPYLMTLVVGDFEVDTERASEVTFQTFYPRGRREDARRCVGRTPQMLAHFETLTGFPYPYGIYSQVFVAEFTFGGMENTTATTLTDTALFDARGALDHTAEPLIAHELAHQWFGDLLTCRDWPHGWLNEGFATYFEVLWKEHSEGRDEADQVRKEELEQYLDEAQSHYARPIVERSFHEPIELFDRHLYQKGGLVLHTLRHELGDALFFKALRHYVQRHQHGAVETVDWSRAIEEVTGRNFDRFFDAHLHRAGHAELKVDLRPEPEAQRVRVQVKQTGDEGFAYGLSLPIRLTVDGKEQLHSLPISEREHLFLLPAAGALSLALVDPQRDVLAALEVEKPVELWREELRRAPEARARTEAALALGKDASRLSVDLLGERLLADSFWGTQAACAQALGRAGTPAARTALLKGLTVQHPKARRAVVAALGTFRGDLAIGKALRAGLAEGDPSGFVEGELARSLGKLRLPGDVPLLREALQRPAFADAIAVGAIDGLAASASTEAFGPVLDLLRYGEPPYRRRAAVNALVQLAQLLGKRTEAADALIPLLQDPQHRIRMAALDAAGKLGERRLIGPLQETPFPDGRLRRQAKETVRALQSSGGPSVELTSLRDELERLRTETRRLKEAVEALQPPPPPPKAPRRRRTAKKGRR